MHGQCPGYRRALAHTARELSWPGFLEAFQPDEIYKVLHDFGIFALLDFQGQTDVALHGTPWQQGRILERNAHAGSGVARLHGFAVDLDRSVRWRFKSCEYAQHRGFAAARWTDQGYERTFRHADIHIGQGFEIVFSMSHREDLIESCDGDA